MPGRRSRLTGGLLAALLIVFPACGGSSPPLSTTPTPSPSEPSPTPCATVAPGPVELCGVVNASGRADLTDQGSGAELRITTPGFTFTPTFVKAEPGATVAIRLENTQAPEEFGSQHAFTIDELDISEVVSPGETTTFTISLPADGEPLPFYCPIGGSQGHVAAGMQGAFYFG